MRDVRALVPRPQELQLTMDNRIRTAILATTLAACRLGSPPQWTPTRFQAARAAPPVADAPTASAGAIEPQQDPSSAAAQVPVASKGASTSRAEPTCEACSYECLDRADTLKTNDPAGAQKLAAIGCDIAKCGHLGRVMMMRCGEYGLPPADPMDCQNECIAECNGEAPRSAAWDKCIKGCEATRGCSAE